MRHGRTDEEAGFEPSGHNGHGGGDGCDEGARFGPSGHNGPVRGDGCDEGAHSRPSGHNGPVRGDDCDEEARFGPSGHNGRASARRCDVFDAVARSQHGVAAGWQLLDAGVSRKVVARAARVGLLHVLHPGIYAVGHAAVSREGRFLAAVLACGPGAALASVSAAILWELLPWREGPIHVVRAGRRRRPPTGVALHHVIDLPATDVRHRQGIPVTAPERTLLDLAAHASLADLDAAVNAARARRLVSTDALVARCARRPGAQALREAVSGGGFTRSEAERRLLRLIRRAGLPMPETNAMVGPYEVDALWRAQRLVVEVDGYAHHSGRREFERDRIRDADLQAAGLRVLRITWRQLTEHPEAVIARIATLLAT